MPDSLSTEATSEVVEQTPVAEAAPKVKGPGHDFGAKIRAFIDEHTSGYEFATKVLYDQLVPGGEQVLRSKVSHILSRMRKSGTLKMPKKGHWIIN